MIVLVLGLVILLGSHSARIFAEDWRRRVIDRIGEGRWKGLYSLVSLIGLGLVIWGYAMARPESAVLWEPSTWLKHVAVALNLVAFILLGAFIVPAGRMKALLVHPMILAIKVWAFAHLLANGRVADLVLFGAVFLWAVIDFATSRRRDRAAGIVPVAGPVRNDALAVVVGFVLWLALIWRLHEWLIGVSPLA